MIINEIIATLESLAPLALQEDYDNSGLMVGDGSSECSGVLCCLDVTDNIIQEAIQKHCNLIVVHHPLVFKGLKKINGKNLVERLVIKAIQSNIAIYAIHTNLDNLIQGVNGRLAKIIGLNDSEILSPKPNMYRKLVTFVPEQYMEQVREALFQAGAGYLGDYSQCSFRSQGWGSFLGNQQSRPFSGSAGEFKEEQEFRLEVVYPSTSEARVVAALKKNHPYQEVAYDLLQLRNSHPDYGAGLIGTLPEPMLQKDFLIHLKTVLGTGCIRHTALTDKPIQRVAICGGAGSFLISNALSNKVDAYLTADLKYHDFFEPDGRLLLCDIGHYESERFTIDLLADVLQEKFPTFAVLKSGFVTNPVHYYF